LGWTNYVEDFGTKSTGEQPLEKAREILSITKFKLNLNSVNQLNFVMVKCGVVFEVRTEFLNNI
jgi:hypothetical protein